MSKGLGSTIDLLKRICHEDKDVLDMIDREIQGKVGAPPSYEQDNLISDEIVYNIHNSKPSVNGAIERPTGTSESAGLRRLRKVLSDAKSNNQPGEGIGDQRSLESFKVTIVTLK